MTTGATGDDVAAARGLDTLDSRSDVCYIINPGVILTPESQRGRSTDATCDAVICKRFSFIPTYLSHCVTLLSLCPKLCRVDHNFTRLYYDVCKRLGHFLIFVKPV